MSGVRKNTSLLRNSKRNKEEDDYQDWYKVWGLEQERSNGHIIHAHLRRAIRRLWEQNPIRIAGLAVFRVREGAGVDTAEWLLLKTSFITHTWSPPKGHLEPGEDDMAAALRETREEAGLEAEQLTVWRDIRQTHRYRRYGYPFLLTLFLARVKDYDQEIRLSSEHQDHKWLRIEDAVLTLWFPEMGTILRKFNRTLSNVL